MKKIIFLSFSLLLSFHAFSQSFQSIGLDPLEHLEKVRELMATFNPQVAQRLQMITGINKPDRCSVSWKYEFLSVEKAPEVYSIVLIGEEFNGVCEPKLIPSFKNGTSVTLSQIFPIDPVYGGPDLLKSVQISPQQAYEKVLKNNTDFKLTFFDVVHYNEPSRIGKLTYKIRGLRDCDKARVDQNIYVDVETGKIMAQKINCPL